MKLELIHLAPYMPYGLNIAYFDDERGFMKYCKISELRIEECTIIDSQYQFDVLFEELKPILRPMSDMSKVINFESKNFIPLIYLYNISNEKPYDEEFNYEFIDSWGAGKILKVFNYNKLDYTEFIYSEFNFRKDTRHEKGFYRYGMTLPHSISVHSELKNQYFLHELLFKWHFDVFGLIDAGLAIDINTVPELLNG